jgi:hypothetical protein
MWLFPWLTLLVVVFIIGIFAVMAIFPSQSAELLSTLGLMAFLVAVGAFLQKCEGPVRTLGPTQRHASGAHALGARKRGRNDYLVPRSGRLYLRHPTGSGDGL